MVYPSTEDFIVCVQNLDKMVLDPIFHGGKFMSNKTGPIRYTGGFSIVFPIEAKNKKYALRCWIANIGETKKRYQAISAYLNQVALPVFVDFQYISEGILTKGKRWPILRMDWVEGEDLKTYIERHINSPDKLEELTTSFQKLVATLHQVKIAHGDLQHRNILVQKDGKLRLIDYDSMCVPDLIGYADIIKGYPAYQHPKREQNTKLGYYIDYFSELVLYVSLRALTADPTLWHRHKISKRENELLFSEQDYHDPHASVLFTEVEGLSYELKKLIGILRNACVANDIALLLPLEDYLRQIEPYITLFSLEKRGEQTFLQWNVAHADTAKLNNALVRLMDEMDVSNLPISTTFNLTAYNKKFNSKPAKASIKIKVAKILSFTSDELVVYEGKQIALSWHVEDARKVELGGISSELVLPVGQKRFIATRTNTAYHLIAYGDTGSVFETVDLLFLEVPKIESIAVTNIALPKQIVLKFPTSNLPLTDWTTFKFPSEALPSLRPNVTTVSGIQLITTPSTLSPVRSLFKRSSLMPETLYSLIKQTWMDLKSILNHNTIK